MPRFLRCARPPFRKDRQRAAGGLRPLCRARALHDVCGRDLVCPHPPALLRRGRSEGRRGRDPACGSSRPPPAITRRKSTPPSARARARAAARVLSRAAEQDSVIIREGGRPVFRRRAGDRIGRRVLATRLAGGDSRGVARTPEKTPAALAVASGFSSVRKWPESTGAPPTLVAHCFQVSSGVAAALAMPASPHSASIGTVIFLPASKSAWSMS